MAIIKKQQITEPTINNVVNEIIDRNTSLIEVCKEALIQNFNRFWNNPEYSPEQMLEAFGTDATALFQASYELGQLIKRADPEFEPPTAPVEIQFNEDGTATIK